MPIPPRGGLPFNLFAISEGAWS